MNSLEQLIKSKSFNSADLITFVSYLKRIAHKRQFFVNELGIVGDDPIFLLRRDNLMERPNLLITAGFHGEEPAGCWGILLFLETASQDLLQNVNLSFIPLVNPTGFKKGNRYNDWGENPNSGFCHTLSGKPETSLEGNILLKHIETLKQLAQDGLISLHEDSDQDKFYLYTFEMSDAPGKFSEFLLQAGLQFFELCTDEMIEGSKANNGIIFQSCDGSFEDFLFHEGIHRTATTETPGLSDIRKRVEANANIINVFAKFAISYGRDLTYKIYGSGIF